MYITYLKLHIIIYNRYEIYTVVGKHDNLNNNKHSNKIIRSSKKKFCGRGGMIMQV